MPQRISTMDTIMAREGRDMFFIRFGGSDWPFRRNLRHPSRRRHFDWFAVHGLRHEVAAPRGWLEGDPGCHAVYFDGPDDPRVALYTAAFEDATGKSLDPDNYQMGFLPYEAWLGGYRSWLEKRRADGRDDDPDGDGPL